MMTFQADHHQISEVAADAPAEGEVARLEVGGRFVLLARVEGVLYAVSDRCTHGRASLSHGWLDGCQIECPLHQGRFDIRNGMPTSPPCTEPLDVYQVVERDGQAIVRSAEPRDLK